MTGKTEQVWHISVQGASFQDFKKTTRVYCGTDVKDIAPYFLPVQDVVHHRGRVTICGACWDNMTAELKISKGR